jgi:uncharacterized flavoprotein (TIGR03862 family)
VTAPVAAVVGGGPAGLMAAEVLAAGGAAVTVYDQMPSVGRKFLMAGRGGLNLTHSEALEAFLARYGAAMPHVGPPIKAFPPAALRAWSEQLGQPTFVGSSGRVFPAALKASPLLRAWLQRLQSDGVAFRLRHRWLGWDGDGGLRFDTPTGPLAVSADATVLALGGASWPRLGCDGTWTGLLAHERVELTPLRPSNCGFLVDWSENFATRFEGHPLKRIALTFGEHAVRGEAVITRTGLEGGALYAISAPLREALARGEDVVLRIALRPDLEAAALEQRLARARGKQSLSTFLRKALNLSPAEIALLHESAIAAGTRLAERSPSQLAGLINAVPIRLRAPMPIEKAISTAGGVAFDELDRAFMLRRRPGTFVSGEMLDWEAPTGGYLLQACSPPGRLQGAARSIGSRGAAPAQALSISSRRISSSSHCVSAAASSACAAVRSAVTLLNATGSRA